MHHFFVTPEQVHPPEIIIEGGDMNHVKNVLRMKVGEKLEISDGNSKMYLCEIDSFETDAIHLQILEQIEKNTELPSKIYLFQGLPKSDKMEFIIQKAVELGVYEVVPVATKRAVVRLDEKKAKKKVERWNLVAEGGAKQSGRTLVPKVSKVLNYRQALEMASKLDITLISYELAEGMEETRTIIDAIHPGKTIGIFIGPEGGFEKEEVDLAMQMGAKAITLGKRILRTETAGLTILSILMYHLEEDETDKRL